MYGAILGDFSGSIYEFDQLMNVSPVSTNILIPDNAFYSDDTILTIAIMDAILRGEDYGKVLKEYIQKYKDYRPNFSPYFPTSFSPGLIQWSGGKRDGTSIGNGSMMRISPVGFLFHSENEVIEQARLATIPSHNSEEAISSATTIALMIYYLRQGFSKEEVYELMGITPKYVPFSKFNVTCSETIGNCLYSFYHSTSFQDAIFRTLFMGGDTDTNCCIVGSLAEAYYGVEDFLKRKVEEKIPKEFVKVLKKGNV